MRSCAHCGGRLRLDFDATEPRCELVCWNCARVAYMGRYEIGENGQVRILSMSPASSVIAHYPRDEKRGRFTW